MPGAEFSCIPVADGMYVPGKRFISPVERETLTSNAILTSILGNSYSFLLGILPAAFDG